MTDAPERIWADPNKYIREWTATADDATVLDVEYVRADVAGAMVAAALEEALKEAMTGDLDYDKDTETAIRALIRARGDHPLKSPDKPISGDI